MTQFETNPLAAIFEQVSSLHNRLDRLENRPFEPPKIEPKEKLITRAEAAKILNCHPDTISKWAADGLLVGKQIGCEQRYYESDIHAFVKPYIPTKRIRNSKKAWE